MSNSTCDNLTRFALAGSSTTRGVRFGSTIYPARPDVQLSLWPQKRMTIVNVSAASSTPDGSAIEDRS
jgi:hypothetical protein